MAGLRDGMGFEEVDQTVTSTATLSGTNVYGATSVRSVTVFGTTALSGATLFVTTGSISGDVRADDIYGVTISGATSIRGANIISAGSVVNSVGTLQATGVGSPTTFGKVVQAGSATVGAGSTVYVTFGTVFGSKPYVTASYRDFNAGGDIVGTVTGSNSSVSGVLIVAPTASKDVDWIAVG